MKKIELCVNNLSNFKSLQDYINKIYNKNDKFDNCNWLDIIRKKL